MWSAASKTGSRRIRRSSDAPVLVITPVPGEASAEDEGFWLQVSPKSTQVELFLRRQCAAGACADAVVEFVNGLR